MCPGALHAQRFGMMAARRVYSVRVDGVAVRAQDVERPVRRADQLKRDPSLDEESDGALRERLRGLGEEEFRVEYRTYQAEYMRRRRKG